MDASEIVLQSRQQLQNSKYPAPLFVAQVTDKIEKVGGNTCFFLSVHRQTYGDLQDERTIKRFIEDFRAFDRHMRLETAKSFPGAPRLSTKETSLVETVPDNNARFMGEYAAERVMFQRYINAVLAHPILGHSKMVEDFLSLPDFSTYSNSKLSLAKRFAGAIDEHRTSSYRDPDTFFQDRKTLLMKYSGAVSDFSNAFTLQNICKKNLSAVMAHFSLSLSSNGHPKDDVTKLLRLSAEAVKQEEVGPNLATLKGLGPLTSFLQYGWHLAYWNGELTLGTFLKHHIAQLDSFKDMMQRRTALLQELDVAKKTAEQAKPLKKEAASAALQTTEQLVERCSTTGKDEVQRMADAEVKGFRQALIDYAESQMQAAQESYEILLEQITKIQDWHPE